MEDTLHKLENNVFRIMTNSNKGRPELTLSLSTRYRENEWERLSETTVSLCGVRIVHTTTIISLR